MAPFLYVGKPRVLDIVAPIIHESGMKDHVAMNDHFELVSCNICGSKNYDVYYSQGDNRFRNTPRDIFQLVRCKQCNLIYLNPRPTRHYISNFYPEAFYDWRKESQKPVMRSTFQARVKSILNISRHRIQKGLREKIDIVSRNCSVVGRILDVGSAEGLFLRKAKSLGWCVEGIEISKELCNYVQETFGIKCYNSPFNHLHLPPASYDVVTFWASLEHLFDPKSAIQKCYRILKKNGLIIILVPNADSLEENY